MSALLRRRRNQPQVPAPEPQLAPPPPAPEVTSYGEVVAGLIAFGFEVGGCPALCRRKTEHTHMRHGSGTADLIVSPAVQ